MQNLLEFLIKNKHWFLFIVLELLSVVLLFRFNSYQGSVYFTSASYVAGCVNEAEAEVLQFFHLKEVNAELSTENHKLQREVATLKDRLLKVTHDTTYIEVRQAEILDGYSMVGAKIVSNSVSRNNNFITIDKGEKDGVKAEQGVVSSNGIVGIVYRVSDHYSLVMPVVNSKSNISCRIRGRNYFGCLHWEGGSPRMAVLDDIPRHAHFKVGDMIETSGYSSVFPEGLLVGQVCHIGNSRDGLSYRLSVRLSTNFSNLRDVNVIVSNNVNEIKLLEQQAVEAEKNEEE